MACVRRWITRSRTLRPPPPQGAASTAPFVSRPKLRAEREERRRRLEAVLDARLEALADALIAKALQGDVNALREALHQLVGRPTEVVQGNPDRPIRIVVESISSRRREAMADVEANEDEVEELGDEEDVA
jgi:hypothetical protein